MNVLYVVGLGPGGSRWMTWEARAALEQAEVLCGYTVYLDLIRGEFPDKEYFSTPMTQEIERCRAALERARSGRTTALVCSGDAGVYGMAGPVLELAPQYILTAGGGDDQQAAARRVLELPGFTDLTAYKEGRYRHLDVSMYMYKPNGRYADAYEQLAAFLYPELFA